MKVHPWDDCVKALQDRIKDPGTHFLQQFNCAGCGAKQTMDDLDVLYETGTCQECGHLTNIKQNGMNYMLMFGVSDAMVKEIVKAGAANATKGKRE